MTVAWIYLPPVWDALPLYLVLFFLYQDFIGFFLRIIRTESFSKFTEPSFFSRFLHERDIVTMNDRHENEYLLRSEFLPIINGYFLRLDQSFLYLSY